MLIIETSVFTRRVLALLQDEEYRLLQLHLAGQPDAGAVIKAQAACGRCAGRLEHVVNAVVYG
jgi:hypothetical protein